MAHHGAALGAHRQAANAQFIAQQREKREQRAARLAADAEHRRYVEGIATDARLQQQLGGQGALATAAHLAYLRQMQSQADGSDPGETKPGVGIGVPADLEDSDHSDSDSDSANGSGDDDGEQAFQRVLKSDEPPPANNFEAARRAIRDNITQSWWFDPMILLCIVGSSVTLAISDPLADENDPVAERLAVADLVFLAIFCLEMVLKMFAHGVVGEICGVDPFRRAEQQISESGRNYDKPGSHSPISKNKAKSSDVIVKVNDEGNLGLPADKVQDQKIAGPAILPRGTSMVDGSSNKKSGETSLEGSKESQKDATPKPTEKDYVPYPYFDVSWNWLDFIIVVAGVVGFIPGVDGAGANAVRLLRVLRPLRTFNRLRGLQVIIGALLGSLGDLLQVVILLIFFTAIFSIIGLQLWSGVLHRTCIPNEEAPDAFALGRGEFYPREDTFSVAGFCTRSPAGLQCPEGYTCVAAAENPGYGVFAFDDIGQSLFSIYVSLTFANWTGLMMPLQDAYARIAPGVYFVLLGLLLNFFASNLVLAVVVDNYGEHAEKARTELALEQAEEDAAEGIEDMEDEDDEQLMHVYREYGVRPKPKEDYDKDKKGGGKVDEGGSKATAPEAKASSASAGADGSDQDEEKDGSHEEQAEPGKEALAGDAGSSTPAESGDTAAGSVPDQSATGDDDNSPAADVGQAQSSGDGQEIPVLNPAGGAAAAAVSGLSGSEEAEAADSGLTQLRRASTAAAMTRTDGDISSPPGGNHKMRSSGAIEPKFRTYAAGGVLRRGNTMPVQSSLQGVGASRTAPKGSPARKRTAKGGQLARLASVEEGSQSSGSGGAPGRKRLAKQAQDEEFVPRTDEQLEAELCAEDKLRDRLKAALRHVREADVVVRRQTEYLVGMPMPVVWTYHMVQSGWFTAFITLCIIANTAFLALDRKGISEQEIDVSEMGNYVLTIVFAVEMVLKLVGLGFWEYMRDAFNVFDCVIVIISIVELIVLETGAGGESAAGGAISALRMLRLLRVLKLAKNIRSLRILLITILQSLPDVSYMAILLGLFLFIFTVLGRQLFAGRFETVEEDSSFAMTSFSQAFFVVFYTATGDDWPTIAMESTAASGTQASLLYFSLLQAMGEYIVLALFVAILLERFEEQTDDSLDAEDFKEAAVRVRIDELQEGGRTLADKHELQPPYKAVDVVARVMMEREMAEEKETDIRRERYFKYTSNKGIEMDGFSLGCLAPDNCFRKWLFDVVDHDWFEAAVILLIFANCVFLAMETPGLDQESTLAQVLEVTDIVFTILFAVEAAMKILAWGAAVYFGNNWNNLDFVIVLVSILALALPDFTAVRALRAFRPLRVVVRSKSIKVVVQALFYALPNIANVAMLTLLFYLIFAILGVSLYKNQFGACNDPQIDVEVNCVGNFTATEEGSNGTEVLDREWETPQANFDDVGTAMVTLFQVATLSDWASVAHSAIDAKGEGLAPGKQENPEQIVYFLAFIIIGSFFSLNLFVGSVIDSFSRLKASFDGSAFLTAEQRRWAAGQKLIAQIELTASPDPPSNQVLKFCFDVASHPYFDPAIMAAIILNTVFMMVEHYQQTDAVTEFLYISNLVFLVVFALEAVLKIGGFGWLLYWRDDWNKFDFIVVLLSLAGLGFDAGVGASVVRVFRVLRIFRLIKRAETLKKLIQTLIYSLPSLFNISALLLVMFYIYAVVGMALFGEAELEPVDDFGLTRQSNFSDFFSAMLLLWRQATGDAWEAQYWTARRVSVGGAIAYFVSFQIVMSLVLVQVMLAVILDTYSETQGTEAEEQAGEIAKIRQWAEVWQAYDKLALRYLPVGVFSRVMIDAPAPFGLDNKTEFTRGAMLRRYSRLRVPLYKRPVSEFLSVDSSAAAREEAEALKKDIRQREAMHRTSSRRSLSAGMTMSPIDPGSGRQGSAGSMGSSGPVQMVAGAAAARAKIVERAAGGESGTSASGRASASSSASSFGKRLEGNPGKGVEMVGVGGSRKGGVSAGSHQLSGAGLESDAASDKDIEILVRLRRRADADEEERKILRYMYARYGSMLLTAEASARAARIESLGDLDALAGKVVTEEGDEEEEEGVGGVRTTTSGRGSEDLGKQDDYGKGGEGAVSGASRSGSASTSAPAAAGTGTASGVTPAGNDGGEGEKDMEEDQAGGGAAPTPIEAPIVPSASHDSAAIAGSRSAASRPVVMAGGDAAGEAQTPAVTPLEAGGDSENIEEAEGVVKQATHRSGGRKQRGRGGQHKERSPTQFTDSIRGVVSAEQAVRKSVLRSHLGGHTEIWCAMFDNTIKALAAEVIEMDVQLETRTDIMWLHEWLAGRIILDALQKHYAAKVLARSRSASRGGSGAQWAVQGRELGASHDSAEGGEEEGQEDQGGAGGKEDPEKQEGAEGAGAAIGDAGSQDD